ncbi:hypothetical protein MTR_8g063670 [Medicago truncatula]|uniref:Uncharacterized protein n=1 Tax=Medicago truncatula TaxID=3880 RepID=A0A072TSZ1_MEDTR|nr:hypothetical protein MTR_8g063670 [Medicago truncatula]
MSPNPPKPILVIVHIPHKDQILHWMHESIENVVDMICYQLHKELIGEENARYRRLIGVNRRYKEVLVALIFCGIGPAPPDKWMTMPDMSFLIAQRYKHMVGLLSIEKKRSETFFPLYDAPSHRE